MKPLEFILEARREFVEALEFHAAIDSGLGRRLHAEIWASINQIRSDPQRFPRFHRSVRRALVRGFPYSILYLDQPEKLWIVAVIHAKRRPGYWKQRLDDR